MIIFIIIIIIIINTRTERGGGVEWGFYVDPIKPEDKARPTTSPSTWKLTFKNRGGEVETWNSITSDQF